MDRFSTKYRFAVVLAFAFAFAIGLGSCDSGTAPEVEAPSLGPVPEWSPSESVLLDRDGDRYTLVQGRIPSHVRDLSVSKLIGLLGGTLDLAGHRLIVPTGAVLEATTFQMTQLTNGYVAVELRATLLRRITRFLFRTIETLLDIGELGFEKPVTIELTYAWATNVTDPSRLVIVRILDDGRVEEVPSEVDTDRKVVRAKLDHFSRYCIAMN